jgi:hypothetical protein
LRFFEAISFRVLPAKRRGRRPRPPTVEAADEPTGDQTFETEASLIVEMDDDDAL